MARCRPTPFVADAETWAVVRAAYAGGATGPAIEKVMGVKADTIWKRARDEGWSRRDGRPALPQSGGAPTAHSVGDEEAIYPLLSDPVDLVVSARKKAGRALHEGRAIDVQRYLRAAQMARNLGAPDDREREAARKEEEENATALEGYREEIDRRIAAVTAQIERKRAEILAADPDWDEDAFEAELDDDDEEEPP